MLNIHQAVKDKLCYFNTMHKIPNIIFHGPSGSGKSTIMKYFLNIIYNNDKNKMNDYTMYVNCVHGKGIKFIRDELKFFSKTNINSNGGNIFKSIILFNGDKLTTDAQSALRRCIELFSHNTRFFIIVEDKCKLLRPILSRFCDIHIPEPEINGVPTNLYKYHLELVFKSSNMRNKRLESLKKELTVAKMSGLTSDKLVVLATTLYEKTYNALDIVKLLETTSMGLRDDARYKLLFIFKKIKLDFRSDKLLLLFMLNFVFIDNNQTNLEQLINI